jgi:hypothetical protein
MEINFIKRSIFPIVFFLVYALREFGVDYSAYDSFMLEGFNSSSLNFFDKEFLTWGYQRILFEYISYPLNRIVLFSTSAILLLASSHRFENHFKLPFFQLFFLASLLPFLGAERQMVAISFCLFAICEFHRKNYAYSCIAVFFAIFSHLSSLIFLGISYFWRISIAAFSIVILIKLILGINLVAIFLPLIGYTDDIYVNVQAEFRYSLFLLKILFILSFLILSYRTSYSFQIKKLFYGFLFIFCGIYFFSSGFEAPILASRFGIYFFSIGSAGIFSMALSYPLFKKNTYIILSIILIFYFSLFYFSPIFDLFF